MSRKSIAAFAKLASHKATDGRQVADHMEVYFTDGTSRQYPATDMDKAIMDCMTYIMQQALQVGVSADAVPIIGMYDCMYDLSLSWPTMAQGWNIEPTAKSPGEVYHLKLKGWDDKKEHAFIFDMRHVMARGIDGTAAIVGLHRDGTAIQDCKIMAAYYEKLTTQYGLRGEDGDKLGVSVMTLTALARTEIKRELSPLTYNRRKGSGGHTYAPRELGRDYALDAAREAAQDYSQYAMRRACMRGGFTFVAAREAGRLHGATISIDENSAFHAQAMCRYVPEEWQERTPEWLQAVAEKIVRKTPQQVLRDYRMPWIWYLHAEVRFTGLRLKPGTIFEHQEIGFMGTARLYATAGVAGVDNEAAVEAERGIRDHGYKDTIQGGVYAFSKIMAADEVTTWVTEQELWCMAQVYVWDTMEVLRGEGATKRKRPDDLSILTSMHYYHAKQTLKRAIQAERDFNRRQYMQAVYDVEVKPKFNAVGYGLHCRDEYRPGWTIDDTGKWALEDPITPENFEDKRPARAKAWVCYGMRIAGGARMQLILALQLIWDKFGDRAPVLCGDTDSIKIRTDIPEEEILEALEPLHAATRQAIRQVTSRAWSLFSEHCDGMEGVGEFEVEGRYQFFYTPNVKQYVSITHTGVVELTLAGVPRSGTRSYAAWLKQMIHRWGPTVLPRVFTFGVTLHRSVSQVECMDYTTVDAETGRLPQVTALDYTLCDPTDPEHAATIRWQRSHGRPQNVDGIAVASWRRDGAVFTYQDGEL